MIDENTKVKVFTGSGSINFEDDRKESLGEVDNAKALSDQVTKLQSLKTRLKSKRKNLRS